VKTQEELREEFRRLFEADMLDEAEAVLEQMAPASEAEVRRILESAPLDDEPITESEAAGFVEIQRLIKHRSRQRAG
jgi:hypothetical protein